MEQPRFAFYGDDFTGSTDAMMALSQDGVRTVLFLEPPDPSDLAEFPDVEAVGLAGTSRTMTPAEMNEALPRAFAALAAFDVPMVHYKVCSTFDSSPEIGSIGRAIELGRDVFDPPFVPLAVGVPQLGRYVVFANHFATVGEETYRLDRHPVMSEHPVTPMTESDLRRHLGDQTDLPIGHVDVTTIDASREALEDAVDDTVAAGDEILLFDTLTEQHLDRIGALLWDRATDADAPLFVVGSSGVEYALAEHWRSTGAETGEPAPSYPDLETVDRLIVVSGSASPVTGDQIAWALDHGFEGIRLDTERLIDPNAADRARREAIAAATRALDDGSSVVLYTARGSDDPAIAATEKRAAELGIGGETVGRRIGEQQGRILRELLQETGLRRTCVAGGDTCGTVTPALDVYALRTISPTAPGSPLCRASARTEAFDGLQIALKGGQLGQEDYFERIRRGE